MASVHESSSSHSNGGKPGVSAEEGYAKAVSSYARQGAEATLFPGLHFGKLATYLRLPFTSRRDSSCTAGFPFFLLYRDPGAGQHGPAEATSPRHIDGVLKAGDVTGRGQMVLLRGQPSPEWLNGIGSRLGVDPEYFQRHLDVLLSVGRANYYVQPSLPSASGQVVQLRYFTLTKAVKETFKAEDTDALRLAARKTMAEYITSLSRDMEREDTVGNSIVRGFHLFSNGRWAIEQSMSLYVSRTAEGNWTAFAWIDTGKDLEHGPRGPWTVNMSLRQNYQDYRAFLPTVQVYPRCSLYTLRESVPPEQRPRANFAQSASLLHLAYGKMLDKDMPDDALYSFRSLFEFCAYSQVQLLNVIEESISEAVDSERPEDLGISQSNLVYAQDLLDKQASTLQGNVEVIRAGGAPSWPAEPDYQDERGNRVCAEAARSLLKDYEYLLARTTRLSETCKSKISHLTSRAALAESKKAMDQAREVTHLTRLAFFYIPLSFVTSFFGMNLSPIQSEEPLAMWWFAVGSVPLLLLSMGLLVWDVETIWTHVRSLFKNEKRSPKRTESDRSRPSV